MAVLRELEYENFNAASAKVKVHGFSIHPGSAKNKMKNAILMAMEFQNMLPVFENPMCTEGYEGFFHLDGIAGDVEETVMDYIIRDHDKQKFEEKKAYITRVARLPEPEIWSGNHRTDLKRQLLQHEREDRATYVSDRSGERSDDRYGYHPGGISGPWRNRRRAAFLYGSSMSKPVYRWS